MQTGTKPQSTSGYATRPTTKPPDWHGLVVWDVLLNNVTTGLFLAATVGDLARPDVFTPAAKVAYAIALVLLLVDLLLLVLDLGDPARFHHMLRVFKPGSPMSLGVWSLTLYSLPLTVVVALDLLTAVHWLPEKSIVLQWIRTAVLIVGVPPAVGSAVYKGVLFSTSSQPGWKDARWLGAYLASSALLLGCAALLLVTVVTGPETATTILRAGLVLLLVVNAVPLCCLVVELRPALVRIYGGRRFVRGGSLAFGSAVLLPLGLLLAGGSFLPVLGSVTFLFLGSILVRHVLVYLPQSPGRIPAPRHGAL